MPRPFEPFLDHELSRCLVLHGRYDAVRDSSRVMRVHEERCVSRNFDQRFDARAHDRRAASHRLDDRKAEAFVQRGVNKSVARLVEGGHVLEGQPSQEEDVVLQAQRSNFPAQLRSPLVPGSDQHEPEAGNCFAHESEGLEQAFVVLVGERRGRIEEEMSGKAVGVPYRFRTRGGTGRERIMVNAKVRHRDPSRGDTVKPGDVVFGLLRYGHDPVGAFGAHVDDAPQKQEIEEGKIFRLVDVLEVEEDDHGRGRAEEGGRHARGKEDIDVMPPDLERQDTLFPEYPRRTVLRPYRAEDDIDPGRESVEDPLAFPVDEQDKGIVTPALEQLLDEVPDIRFRAAHLARQQVKRVYADPQGSLRYSFFISCRIEAACFSCIGPASGCIHKSNLRRPIIRRPVLITSP